MSPGQPHTSSESTTWTERVAAASLLGGLPVTDASDSDAAPDLCRLVMDSSLSGTCTSFHSRLREDARRLNLPVFATCHAGLTCFAFQAGDRVLVGGYVRTEGATPPVNGHVDGQVQALWEQVPERPQEELEGAARAMQVLLGGAEDRRRDHDSLVFQSAALLSSALNLDQLMNDVLNLAVQLSRSDAGSLHLVENQRLTRHVTTARAPSGQAGQHRLRPSLMGWLQERSARQSTETVFGDAAPLRHQDYASALFVPLILHDRTRAHLTLYSRRPRRFKTEEIELLESFAAQAALAIENAQVFEAEQKRARESTALYHAARTIGDGETLGDVLEASARALSRTAEVDRALVFMADRHRPLMTLATSVGLTPDQREFFSAYRLNLGQISDEMRRRLLAGRPLQLTAPPDDSPGLARLITLVPSSSCLVVPLLSEDRLAGLVLLDDSRGPHPFPDSSVWLVMALAVQVGMALRRAGLFAELEENLSRFRALYQVSTAVTGTLSLPRLLRLIVLQALNLVEESACAVLVLNETGEDFYVHTSVGLPEQLLELSTQAGFARLAVERQKVSAVYLDRDAELADSQPGKVLREAGFGGILAVPLVARQKMVGVLNCFAPRGRHFHRQEIRLLRGFANHAAIAVDNARLHGKLRLKMGELETLFEVSRAVTSTLQLDRVLSELVRHVVRLMNADACTLRLIEGQLLQLKAAEGLNPSNLSRRITLGEGVLGLAAQTGSPITVIDGQEPSGLEFPRTVRAQGMRTILSVPIEHREHAVGVINVYHRQVVHHTQSDINLLTALGSQAGVAIENARIYAEKERVASLLHDALIPRKGLGFPGLGVGHKFIPSRDLSGDYYDLIPLGTGRCGLVIADVSGKGAEAAIQTVRVKHLLRSFAMSGHPPRDILRLVNDHLSRDDSSDLRQVTVFYAEADLATRRLYYACAGHEPAVLWHPGEEPRLLEADGILMGAVRDARFEERAVGIPEGTGLLLYTDGITEARDPAGRFFDLDRLLQIVNRYGLGDRRLSPQSLADRIHSRVRQFTGKNLADDFSVLVVQF